MTQPAPPPSRLNPTPPPSTKAQPSQSEQYSSLQVLDLLNGRGTPPTSHAASAPPDQRWIAYFDPEGTLAFTLNKNFNESAPSTTVYGSADAGYFRVDGQGNAVPVQQPNADALIDKAVDRQTKEAQRNERQANADAGKGYVSATERATIENNARARGLDQQRIDEEVRQFGINQQNKDREEKRLSDLAVANIAKTGAEVGLIGAQVGRTGAETTQIGAQTAALQAKTPSEIEENVARAGLAGAQTGLAQQQIEDLKRKAQLPTIEDLGTGATYGVMGPTGQIEERYRQGYVPKTTGEVQARIGQINALANQKRDELMAKVGAGYTAEQAFADFQKWHGQNVQPHIQSLQVAGEEAAITRGKELATMRTAAYTSALGAGTLAQRAISDQQQRTVSNDFLGEMGKVWNATAAGERAGPIDYTKLARPDRDVNAQAQQATAEALKWIDRDAARMTGAPDPTWMNTNPQAALNMTSLWGAQPTAPGAGVGAPTPIPGSNVAMPQDPNWQRADQNPGQTPQGNALAAPGMAGTVPVGSPQYLGTNAADVAAQQQAAAQAQTDADLAALMAEQQANDVYAYGAEGATAAAPNPMAIAQRGVRRPVSRPTPVAAPAPPPTVVNPAPFYQQALAAGLGGGGAQWTPAQPPQFWPVGDETNPGPNPNQGYVPQPYVYGGMYAMPSPY